MVNVGDAKANLSRLLRRVEAGEEIVIARAGTPVARLVPYTKALQPRAPGSARGLVSIGPNFDDPAPQEFQAWFE